MLPRRAIILNADVSTVRRIVFGQNPRRTTVRIAVLAVVCIVTFGWVLLPVRADGDSMLPTYASGKLTLVNRLSYVRSSPQRGDIVAIRLAGPRVVYIKRIIGLPGERLSVEEGQVRIDGSPLVEPYVRHQGPWSVDEVTLGAHEYFVVGDNRGTSVFGRVEAERILGRLVF
jgi:signal peptidase I